MDDRPIGVFDSGVGGLTVVDSLTRSLPKETIVYVGDTARVPYGNKSKNRIRQYASEITEWLSKKDCKIIASLVMPTFTRLLTLISKFS